MKSPFYGNERNPEERIGRLETAVDGLHAEFTDIRFTLRTIQDSVSRSRETNWGVVLAGLAVAGSLYAAAIRPLEQEVIRQRGEATDIAHAVVRQDERASAVVAKLDGVVADSVWLKAQLADVRDHGSPIMDKRLTLLEYRQNLDDAKHKKDE